MTPENQKFMQITMSPREHLIFLADKRQYYNNDAYWECLPEYIISRCPICNAPDTAKLDIHSLMYWHTLEASNDGHSFFWDKHEHVGCEHRLAVQKFVNLEGLIPSELRKYHGEAHVPFFTSWMAPRNRKSMVAVIHSFAVCRLEDGNGNVFDYVDWTFKKPLNTPEEMNTPEHKWREYIPLEDMLERTLPLVEDAVFVPRYTAYSMSYYGHEKDRKKVVDARMKPQRDYAKADREYDFVWLAGMGEMQSNHWAYNLAHYAEKGKLKWLDLESADLPLKSEPIEDFPYSDIQFDFGNHHYLKY